MKQSFFFLKTKGFQKEKKREKKAHSHTLQVIQSTLSLFILI